MKYLKFAPWGISALVFLLIASFVLSAAMIVVDFYDGIEKEEFSNNIIIPEDNIDIPDDESEGESKQYVTNLSEAYGAGFVEGLLSDISLAGENELEELYKKLTGSIPVFDDSDGMSVSSSGIYDGMTNILVKSDIKFDGGFSTGKETVNVAVKQVSSGGAIVKIVYEDKEVDVKTLELYMGYILINSEDGVCALYDGEGELLVSDMGDKAPANKRTASGEAVFTDASGAYYVLSEETNEFVSVEENKIVSALEYDYPAYSFENENGEQIYAVYDSAKKNYKYYNAATSEQAIKTNYSYALSFDSNGYAFVKTTGGTVCIIDSAGKVVNQPSVYNYKCYPTPQSANQVYVRRYYELPYVKDISAIGSGTVDENGWTRVRTRLIGRSESVYGKTLADYETIVNVFTGELFEIPKGYTLEGYSDGVLLLSKDGRYGYYSLEGKWIAHPIYTYASPFIQGLAVVGYEGGTLGMIDTKGNIVLPFAFSHISNVSSGLVSAYSESGGWEIFKLVEKTEN